MTRNPGISSSGRSLSLSAVVVLLLAGSTPSPPALAESSVEPPSLAVQRLIQTTPFAGTERSMRDNEGSAYVPSDRSLWMVDDEGQRIFAVNARTGALQRVIGRRALESVRRFRGSAKAGNARSRDLESVAYDSARDRLYVFSGSDCWPSTENCRVASKPTAFRLDRRKGRLRLHSFQPLPAGRNNNAAAWNPRSGRTFVGDSQVIRRYSYRRNRYGPPRQILGVTGLLGMDFTSDGRALMVTHAETLLSRVDWRATSLTGGWTVDLASLHVRDARAVEVIGGRLFVSDGADDRAVSSPYRYAVFVLDTAS